MQISFESVLGKNVVGVIGILRENLGSVGLGLLIVFLLYDTFKTVRIVKVEPEIVEEERGFTLEELSKYDGLKDKKVYVACSGTVFDVSSSGFYAPNAPYHIFAGKDASRYKQEKSQLNYSRALAKNAFIEETGDEQKIALTLVEAAARDEWKRFFHEKYRVAGWVI